MGKHKSKKNVVVATCEDESRTTVTLQHPIQFGEQRITELAFRPLKGKDLRKLRSTSSSAQTMELAGYLSGQPTQVIDELQGEDLMEVLELIRNFTGDSQETGDTESLH